MLYNFHCILFFVRLSAAIVLPMDSVKIYASLFMCKRFIYTWRYLINLNNINDYSKTRDTFYACNKCPQILY